MAFLDRLRRDAYDDLDAAGHEPDLQGWMCERFEGAFRDAVRGVRAPLVVEVGTWKGRSAVAMARACESAVIVAVDTWLGAPEFWTWGLDDPTRGGGLNKRHGFPGVFYTFAKNVKALGLHGRICPLPLSSAQAADVLRFHGVAADVVYLDAAHEYDAVASDLRAYWDLLRPGGTALGDDYCPAGWPGVVRAVDEFAASRGLRVRVDGVVWALRKPDGSSS